MSSTMNKKGNIMGAEQNGFGWDAFGNIGAWNMTAEGGEVVIKELSGAPTAVSTYGKLHTKSDNKLYFQDGGGTDHEIAYVP